MTLEKINQKLTSLLALGCSLFIVACNSYGPEDIIGTWENVSIKVEIASENGGNESSQLIVSSDEWEEKLMIKTILTTYSEDGNFTSSYISPEGKSIGEEKGRWFLRNDSLILESPNYRNSYSMEFKNDQVHFTSLLDWDQDGEKDDLYDGWQRKVR